MNKSTFLAIPIAKTHHVSLIILLLTAFSCTDFKEVLPYKYEAYDSIGLDIPHLNDRTIAVDIIVDGTEFSEMYDRYNEEIEIYGKLKIYRSKNLVFARDNVRFKVKGRSTVDKSLKSLGIRFDEPVCNVERNILDPEQILAFHSLDQIESLRLRNSGNDFNTDATMIKDLVYTQLAIRAGLNIDLMYGQQAVVFINQLFYGVLNLRTESTARGIAHIQKCQPKDITLAKIYTIDDRIEVERQHGDYSRITKFLDAIASNNLNYLKDHVDLNNFIDYVIFQTYVANRDWPHNNVKFYACNEGKFRFFMFDLDLCNRTFLNKDPVFFLNRAMKNPVGELFNLLYTDGDFRTAYTTRYQSLLKSGLLDTDQFSSIMNASYKNIESVMPIHIEKHNEPSTMVEWYRNLGFLQANFTQREKLIKKMILEE